MIDGQKVFTTHAQDADYIWLAARTDPDAPKHKGISIILVPTKSPGFSVTPIYTLGGERTNVTYYEGVRVPVENRVGPEHQGLFHDGEYRDVITLAAYRAHWQTLVREFGHMRGTDRVARGATIALPSATNGRDP